jgi:hypothetical protein
MKAYFGSKVAISRTRKFAHSCGHNRTMIGGDVRGRYSRLKSDLKKADLLGMLKLPAGLRDFFREPVTVQCSEEEIKKALKTREERFLQLVLLNVYQCPSSPYLKLLKIAGCEYSDLRTCVRHSGIEETLKRLAREGVYLTSEEFKGKKEVIRGRQSFRVLPSQFETRSESVGYPTQSSGTRNQPVRSFVSLGLLKLRSPVTSVFFAAHNLFSHSHAMYDAILPGSAGLNNLLIYARIGVVADRWFARAIPINTRLEGLYHYLTSQFVVLAAKCFGPGFPRPEFIKIDQVRQIIHWLAAQQKQNKACCITTAASNAVRIARIAADLGVSLQGTKFIVTGEPFTESKRNLIQYVGATATPRYAYGGSINIGFGCANPLHTDEIHVNQHLLALLPNPRPVKTNGSCLSPLLCTTLHPAFPRTLFNVESGDYGYLIERDCGCALGKVGLSVHLHHIRSFEKFTSEGMNYFYGDLFEIFEKLLPAEFGGGPGDYQLVEEEDSMGQTRLTLVVHPGVEELDECKVLARLRTALSKGPRGNRFMAGVWENAGTFRIKRKVPYASPRGKILPLHIPHSCGKTSGQ